MATITARPPRRIGDLLDLAFQVYRAHFATLVGIVALPLVPLAVVRLLLVAPAATAFDLLRDLVVVQLIAGVLAHAAVRLERRLPVTPLAAYHLPLRRYIFLLGALLLQALIIGAPMGVLGGCLVLAFMPISVRDASFMLGGALLAFLAVPGLYLIARTLFIAQAVMAEGCNPEAAFKRSWALTRDGTWRIEGIVLLTTLLSLLVSALPAQGAQWALATLEPASAATLLRNEAIVFGVGQLGLLLMLPLQTLIYTLLYIDIRVRREGYDIALLLSAAR
ncbi:MAG: hypothetical protein H7Y32_03830 [Chloroflexales bacterium]|nr:hypothetical protein [Chloroflexales bacterium]